MVARDGRGNLGKRSGCPKGNTVNSRGCKPTERKASKSVPALEGPDNALRTTRSKRQPRWGWDGWLVLFSQVETCGYPQLAPDGARASPHINKPIDVDHRESRIVSDENEMLRYTALARARPTTSRGAIASRDRRPHIAWVCASPVISPEGAFYPSPGQRPGSAEGQL